MAGLVVALDGGGSRTRALALDGSGQVLGTGLGGASAFVRSGGAVVFDSVAEALQQAVPFDLLKEPALVAFCLGGGNGEEACAAVKAVLPEAKVGLVGEVGCALALGQARSVDLVVLVGTGVIAGANCGDSLVACGGMGAFTGDEGGGFWVGWEAVRAVIRALDGRAPGTLLEQLLLAESQLSKSTGLPRGEVLARLAGSPTERRGLAYRLVWGARAMGRQHIGALSPYVSQAAREGDEVAQALLVRAGGELARYALALGQELETAGAKSARAGFLGGLVRSSPEVLEGINLEFTQARSGLAAVILEGELVFGAALKALECVLTQEQAAVLLEDWSTKAHWAPAPEPEWIAPEYGSFEPGSLASEFGSIA